MRELQVGEVYYSVSFADPALRIPRVEPMMFIGTNLFPEHEEQGVTSYYFRDPTEPPEEEESEESAIEYFTCTAEELSSFYTLVEAIAKLSLVAAGVDLTRPPGSRGLNL